MDISFHYLINIGQVRHHFSCLVYDEARTTLIRKVLNTLGGDYLDKLDMSVSLGDGRKVHVDQIAELVAVLVEMEHNKRLWICFGDFPNILIPRYFDQLTIFFPCSFDLYFLHSFCHVLFGKFIFKIYISSILPRSSSS